LVVVFVVVVVVVVVSGVNHISVAWKSHMLQKSKSESNWLKIYLTLTFLHQNHLTLTLTQVKWHCLSPSSIIWYGSHHLGTWERCGLPPIWLSC